MASFAGHFYFSPRGRTGRRFYWLMGVLPLLIAGFLIGFVAASLRIPRDNLFVVMGILTPVALWIWICVGARRLHDIGVSGWWMILVLLAPLTVSFALPEHLAQLPALLAMIVLGVLPGVAGDNRFGRDPRARRVQAAADAVLRTDNSGGRPRER
jgi:uncharacterized membrane protein YhaH (DUF805 family)